jgi:hypothetical protein
MNIKTIVRRIATAIPVVDQNTEVVTPGRRSDANGQRIIYLPGVPSMHEKDVSKEVLEWWKVNKSSDFKENGFIENEVPYPEFRRQRCDMVIDVTDAATTERWAIEIKRLQFIGDNGKKNDHGVQKMLSPYLKDRSVIHDMRRLQVSSIADRSAVVGYAFKHSFRSCDEAQNLHPEHETRINQMRSVCLENDPISGRIDPMDLIEYANRQFQAEDIVHEFAFERFTNAWRHPCGGTGIVFGWEIKK